MTAQSATPEDYDEDWLNEICWNCDGQGFVANCWDEIGCVDPEEGCDLCTRRCDVCGKAA